MHSARYALLFLGTLTLASCSQPTASVVPENVAPAEPPPRRVIHVREKPYIIEEGGAPETQERLNADASSSVSLRE